MKMLTIVRWRMKSSHSCIHKYKQKWYGKLSAQSLTLTCANNVIQKMPWHKINGDTCSSVSSIQNIWIHKIHSEECSSVVVVVVFLCWHLISGWHRIVFSIHNICQDRVKSAIGWNIVVFSFCINIKLFIRSDENMCNFIQSHNVWLLFRLFPQIKQYTAQWILKQFELLLFLTDQSLIHFNLISVCFYSTLTDERTSHLELWKIFFSLIRCKAGDVRFSVTEW